MANVIVANKNRSIVSIEDQIDLIKKFGLPETAVERHYVRIDMENGKKRFVLCKREHPIYVFDTGSGKQCIAVVQKTQVEKLGGLEIKLDGLLPEVAKAVVENQLCQSVEVGEIDQF